MDNDLNKLAELLGSLIEKYFDKIDLDDLPDPVPPLQTDTQDLAN